MKTLAVLFVISAILVLLASRRKGNSRPKCSRKTESKPALEFEANERMPVELRRFPNSSPQKQAPQVEKPKFAFPKYGVRETWVKITDKTPYREIWSDLDRNEKLAYSISDFEDQFSNGEIELEIAPFWEALRGAKKVHLGKFGALAGHIETLEEIWSSQFQDYEDNHNLPFADEKFNIAPRLGEALQEMGVASRVNLANPINLEEWLQLKSLAELKAIAKARSLAVSGPKAELAIRICKLPDASSLYEDAFYCTISESFVVLLEDLAKLYVEKIALQIQTWHPLYIRAVWEEVSRENDGFSPSAVLVEARKMLA